MNELCNRLDVNRQFGKRLDDWWGNLKWEQFGTGISDQHLESEVLEWWERITRLPSNDSQEKNLLQAVNDCITSRKLAESDPDNQWNSLRTWVIRHNKMANLPRSEGKPDVLRREKRLGASIKTGAEGCTIGLPLSQGTALPFLLAVRAQGELAAKSSSTRAFFAEGLCSSYETFHHTHENRGDIRDVNDEGVEQKLKKVRQDKVRSLVPVDWYEKQVAKLIPSLDAPQERRYNHPKIRPVVERVVDLWEQGEKVLVFCFYRQTAKALRTHLKKATENRIFTLIARKLRIKNDAEIVAQAITRIIRRLSDEGFFHNELVRFLGGMIDNSEYAILKPQREKIIGYAAGLFPFPCFPGSIHPF